DADGREEGLPRREPLRRSLQLVVEGRRVEPGETPGVDAVVHDLDAECHMRAKAPAAKSVCPGIVPTAVPPRRHLQAQPVPHAATRRIPSNRSKSWSNE